MKARLILPWLLTLALPVLTVGVAGAREPLPVYLFYAEGCSACIDEKAFLKRLGEQLPNFEVRLFEAQFDEENRRLLARATGLYGQEFTVVPVTFIGADEPVIGFRGVNETGVVLENRIRRCLAMGCRDPFAALLAGRPEEAQRLAGEGSTGAAAGGSVLSLPVVGRTDLARLPLLTLAVVLGALDSFNPCAFFVLFTLLSILVHAHSRRRMLFVGGIFVAFSALVYFLFMAAWLNLFLRVGEPRLVTAAAGVVALLIAAINVKDYFFFKQGVSLSIPDSRKPGLYERMRGLVQASTAPALALGTVVLAVAANTYELLCTAGFPMVFTRILTLNRITPAEHYLYLAIYNLVYVVPMAFIVVLFSFTLGARKLSEEQGRVLKLVSGFMMLGLGLVVLIDPGLFNRMFTGVALLGLALAATGVALVLERQWKGESKAGSPRGGQPISK